MDLLGCQRQKKKIKLWAAGPTKTPEMDVNEASFVQSKTVVNAFFEALIIKLGMAHNWREW